MTAQPWGLLHLDSEIFKVIIHLESAITNKHIIMHQSNYNQIWYKDVLRIPKLILITCKKNISCSKLLLLQSLNYLGWNILLTRVVYLMIDTYNYFIILRFVHSISPFNVGDHSFSTYAKFSKKVTFATPWYAHVRYFYENFAYVLN